MSLGTLSIGGTNASDFLVASAPSTSVAPGSSTSFTLDFRPTATGTRTATVSFSDNDPTQVSPFTFVISGLGLAPSIGVAAFNQPIADGAITTSTTNGTDFGSATLGSTTDSITYTITNSGTGLLELGTPLISPAGSYSITTQPASSVAAGSSTTMIIRFSPTTGGAKPATVSFTEDDPSQPSPFTFAITGVGAAPKIAVIGNGQTISANSLNPSTTNDTDFGNVIVNTGGETETYTISKPWEHCR